MLTIGVFTSTGVTGYKGIRVTFCNVFKWRKVTLLPCYRVTPVLVNTPNGLLMCEKVAENCTQSKNKGDEHLFFCSYDKLTDTNLYAVFTSFPVIYTGVSSSLILFLALLTK